ncbi:MAG: hypothetical protein ABJF10_00495 [Chthoniobacter sp.]|uniref:beta strand repeat-containing protein n=1 Tax=Chthoniobacter sp. TaxID=2510640 RepID=UPI0032AE7426
MKTVPVLAAVHGLIRKSLPFWALPALLSFSHVDSVRAQGYYYPVYTPATTTSAPVYNFQPYAGIPEYAALDGEVRNAAAALPTPQLMSIYIPTPAGYSPPTAAVFEAALNRSVSALVNDGIPGVTLQSLVLAATQYMPADRVALGNQVSRAIVTKYAADPATASSLLTSVVDALALSQPTLAVATIQGMLGTDATGKTAVGSVAFNTAGAHVIADIVAETIAAISTDTAGINSVLGTGVGAISAANLSAVQKSAAVIDSSNGLVQIVLSSSGAQNNQANVATIVKNLLSTVAISLVPPTAPALPVSNPGSSIGQILGAAVNALQFVPPTNTAQDTLDRYNLIALTDGALSAQGASNAAGIRDYLNSNAIVGTTYLGVAYSSYTTAVANGYLNGTTAAGFSSYLAGTAPGYAAPSASAIAAAASGAVTKNAGLIGSFVQAALTAAPTTQTRDVVFASVLASPTSVNNAIVGAINPTGGPGGIPAPYGGGSFLDVAWGIYQAGPNTSAIGSIQLLIGRAGTLAASGPIFTSTLDAVTKLVAGAVGGADAGGKAGIIADIIYQAASSTKGSAVGYSGPVARAAADAIAATPDLGPAANYIAVVAALAGNGGAYRQAILDATVNTPGVIADITAANNGADLVQSLQTDTQHRFYNTLTKFSDAAVAGASSVNADLIGAILANNGEADAALAVAIKESGVNPAALTATAIGVNTPFNANSAQVLTEVSKIASIAKTNLGAGASVQLFPYIGTETIAYPSLVRDIAIAWTVVDPDHAHYVATAVAFAQPNTANTTVSAVFQYTQITNATPHSQGGILGSKAFPGTRGTVIDQPAAAAAITAGYVTGILESDQTFRFGVATSAINATTLTNLKNVVGAAVAASITQSGTNLQGPIPATGSSQEVFNATSPGYSNYFRQSDGTSTTSFYTTGNNRRTVGAAGAVTGFVAQLTSQNDSTISAVTAAVLTQAGTSAKAYGLQMAQAAAQAFAWVSAGPAPGAVFSYNFAIPLDNAAHPDNPVWAIANALFAGGVTGVTMAQLENAAFFGITEANNGTIGAGALGLNAKGLTDGTLVVAPAGNPKGDFYIHASATGVPVTNIFNL